MESGRILLISGIAILVTGVVGAGVILLLSSLDIIDPFGGGEIEKPEWEVGDHWTYTFRTPDLDGARASKIVISDFDGENWQLGAEEVQDARLHAVLNYNPILGRINKVDYGVYENGVPEPLFKFPLEKGKTWSFDFVGTSWDAEVVSVETRELKTGQVSLVAVIEATGPGGDLSYSFAEESGWILDMIWDAGLDENALEMHLSTFGDQYTGDTWFIRGSDLHDDHFQTPPAELNTTITIDDGPWEQYIYFLNVDSGSDGTGSISIKDNTGLALVQELVTPGVEYTQLGALDAGSGTYDYVIDLQGTTDVRVRIAGGEMFEYTIT